MNEENQKMVKALLYDEVEESLKIAMDALLDIYRINDPKGLNSSVKIETLKKRSKKSWLIAFRTLERI